MSKKTRAQKKARANQKAQVILQVRSGLITATEGAQLLGVSRKTYYEYENRALIAMAKALEEGDTGRPSTLSEDDEKTVLNQQIDELQTQGGRLRLEAVAKEMLDELEARNRASGLAAFKKKA